MVYFSVSKTPDIHQAFKSGLAFEKALKKYRDSVFGN
jgi:hypothetical protein